MDAVVVGAGVVGLTTAIRLRQAGFDAHVVARELPAYTTSAVAAALWYPYRALPQDRVTAWSARSYAVLAALAAEAAVPVTMRRGRELFATPVPDPWWQAAVPDLERVRGDDLPPGYADGFSFTAPVLDMPHYLRWLVDTLTGLGGTLERRSLASLDDLPGNPRTVVDCAGLGARELAADPSLVPVRGQVVYVEQFGLDEWLLDQEDAGRLTYIVPRHDDVVLGGTAESGVESGPADPTVAAAIVRRCAALEPRVTDALVLGHNVGARPTRPAVRLEAERRPGRTVVHCYGHGGAGVTLSWGCAEEVVSLVGATG
ncbi:MAG: FAD-binding oxidoreductase [Acidothermales bacterium]|jgi:D-amino-acid oxidase|nr:FAD-binding oxidoreductase [Acidothermales bacterium]